MLRKDYPPDQNNFNRYRMIRLREAPKKIDVSFVENDIDPTGLGETTISACLCSSGKCIIQKHGQTILQPTFINDLKDKSDKI